jgi:hypothetical protein
VSAASKEPPPEPTGDEIDELVHRLTRTFSAMNAPANHITAAVCFLIGIQGQHGGRCTLAQAQAMACKWIEKGWQAYARWSVVDMPKELPGKEAP